MDNLSDLPNIGKKAELKLKNVDVKTPEELRTLGSKEAYLRLRILDDTACFSCLCALEGAVQGIRWHHLSEETKQDLKRFFDDLNIRKRAVSK